MSDSRLRSDILKQNLYGQNNMMFTSLISINLCIKSGITPSNKMYKGKSLQLYCSSLPHNRDRWGGDVRQVYVIERDRCKDGGRYYWDVLGSFVGEMSCLGDLLRHGSAAVSVLLPL